MRHRSFTVVFASSSVIVLAAAYFYRGSFQSISPIIEPTRATSEQQPSVITRESDPPIGLPPGLTTTERAGVIAGSAADSVGLPLGAPQEATRERMRQRLTSELPAVYSLLFEHLGSSRDEETALLGVLVDIQMSSGTRGKAVGEQERAQQLAAILGDAKLRRFLELERNFASYAEVSKAETLLNRNGVPLKEAQREGLFKIFVDVRTRYETAPSDVRAGSIESLENMLTEMAEYERLVIELAPSVLSSKQTGHLFEQYQYLAYQRAADLERQRKLSADLPAGTGVVVERD